MHAPYPALLTSLDATLVTALLPLSFERRWDPVRALTISPALPDTWWGQVSTSLQLPADEDGQITVPDAVLRTLQGLWRTTQPRAYQERARRAARQARGDGDLFRALELFHDLGDTQEAEETLRAFVLEAQRHDQHLHAIDVIDGLPPAWVSPALRGLVGISRLKTMTGDAAVRTRVALQREYDEGERNPYLLHALSFALQLDGHYGRALHVVDEALTASPGDAVILALLGHRSMVLGYLKRPEEQLATTKQLLMEATRLNNLRFTAIATAQLAYALEDSGDIQGAEIHFLRGIELLRRIGDAPQLLILLNNFSQMLASAGRTREALERLEEAEVIENPNLKTRAWLALTRLVVTHQGGRHSAALAAAPDAVRLMNQLEMRADELTARLLHSERLALDGNAPAAQNALHRAQALTTDDPFQTAQYAFTQGVVAFHAGDTAEATRAFGETLGTPLTPWDQARRGLYLAALSIHTGQTPDLPTVGTGFVSAGNDGPLDTDRPTLSPVLDWLRRQPGWSNRLAGRDAVQESAGSVNLRLEPYGPLIVNGPDGVLRFRLKRSAELLAYLALHGPTSRRDLHAALFDGPMDGRSEDLLKKSIKSLRAALAPYFPEEILAVEANDGRLQLNSRVMVRMAWLPPGLFPAPGIQLSGPLEVRGRFLEGSISPWVHDVQEEVHAHLPASAVD